jgi:hypothetical protein
MDTDAMVRRFRHERQILASLQHPYIAGLLDGGSTSDAMRVRHLRSSEQADNCRAGSVLRHADGVSPTIGSCSPITTKTRHNALPS